MKLYIPAKTIVKRSSAGLGLFAKEPIKKGVFIIEYVGELITQEEGNRRGGKYLFELNKKMMIDGKARNNTARYANHSCKPNAEIDIKKGRILMTSIKPIKEGDEITYDYGKEYVDEFIKPFGCRCASCALKKKQ